MTHKNGLKTLRALVAEQGGREIFETVDVYMATHGNVHHERALDMDKVWIAFADFYPAERQEAVHTRREYAQKIATLATQFNQHLDSGKRNLDTLLAAAYVRYGWSEGDIKQRTGEYIRRLERKGVQASAGWKEIAINSLSAYGYGLVNAKRDYDHNLPREVALLCREQDSLATAHTFAQAAPIVFATGVPMTVPIPLTVAPYSRSCSDIMEAVDSICPRFSREIMTSSPP